MMLEQHIAIPVVATGGQHTGGIDDQAGIAVGQFKQPAPHLSGLDVQCIAAMPGMIAKSSLEGAIHKEPEGIAHSQAPRPLV
ncbi:hypothetical protein CCP4SC76_7490002 [Gammaproteobacteria bacterium]